MASNETKDIEELMFEQMHDLAMSSNEKQAVCGRFLKEVAPVWLRLLEKEHDRGTSPTLLLAATPTILAGLQHILAKSILQNYDAKLAKILSSEFERVLHSMSDAEPPRPTSTKRQETLPMFFPALAFDTETTDLIKFKLAADHPDQARMCQIGAVLMSEDRRTAIETFEAIIKPDGWVVTEEASAINGLTTEICEAEGIPIAEAIDQFMDFYERAAVLVGFNLNYDTKSLRGELRRLGHDDRFGEKLEADCMHAARPLCGLPKPPTLVEAVRILLDEDHEGAHTALADAVKTGSIYRLLVERSAIAPKHRGSFKRTEAETSTAGRLNDHA